MRWVKYKKKKKKNDKGERAAGKIVVCTSEQSVKKKIDIGIFTRKKKRKNENKKGNMFFGLAFFFSFQQGGNVQRFIIFLKIV